jgi:hypothetical protein
VLRFQLIRILQLTAAILLAGRAWQHLFWDAPYQYFFSGETGFTDWFSDKLTIFMGWFYLFGVVFCFTLDKRDTRWGNIFVFYSAAGAYAWYASGIYYGHKVAWIEGLNNAFGTGSNSAALFLYALAAFEIIIILVLWVKPLQKIAFAGILFWGILLMIASVALFFMEHPHWQSGVRSAWELLCLVPNAGLSYAIWKYVNEKKKEEDF